MDQAALQQVRVTPLFADLADEHLACIEPGEVIDIAAGTVLETEGNRAAYFYVTLEGQVRITRRYDRQEVLMGVSQPGGYMGETMLLLDAPWLATARAVKPTRLFRLDAANFWRMLSTCPSVAREIFRAAATRMRNMEGYSHQREKLISLGTMAAGLAHELNNPAAAGRRAAAHLEQASEKAQTLLCRLMQALQKPELDLVFAGAEAALKSLAEAPVLDHLARSDGADRVATWLESRGVPSPWDVAPTFVGAGLDVSWLAEWTSRLPSNTHSDALIWLEVRLSLKTLLTQVAQSTERISELVKAVKAYSFMDQSAMQEVDLHAGLESTLTMLGHKLKNVTVVRDFDRSVPPIMAYGSELNQVWTNLIDNAIHAVQGSGRICLSTAVEDTQVVVEIVDNGPGIPLEIQSRMFEPFFTTKAVGSGTGLGLIISNRIVADRHGGEIEFDSQPGETRFKVRLPILRSTSSGLDSRDGKTH